ncbi:hypothetical protein KUM39_20315 [Streptomyces sp. J2-1]|uniref:hypothetical protein n=1 Tax=Streptomyces corallincola TaxID=2851888 RepID=UPI001C37FDEF|nr:hypothetical protein [Streptomyces corallincola]MBV2356690.1 hypothetical protein [Streptomyces corallincola]
MNETTYGAAETAPVEERLRAALAARAESVRPADLRPLRPPTGGPALRPVLVRRVALGLLALAAAAALVFLGVRGAPSHPAEPARPGHPTPTPTPTGAMPSRAAPSSEASGGAAAPNSPSR